jgi:hypothetical protein
VHLVLAAIATGWLLHTTHVAPLAQPGLTRTLFALHFRRGRVWGWIFGLTGRSVALPL